MDQILKQAQAMQEKFKQELNEMTVEGSSGGGMVTVQMTGNKVVTGLTIDPEVVDRNDVEMLQDLITAAVNETARKIDEETQRRLGSLAGGLNIPGLF
ncbi:MAG TPA: YbaB/EbfC family nucleoid-associated protein [Vicinamibacteria bacterium]|nr:YbaB/EbfC family nucleoid-associated protein [Vicinamibacteria bacterium]